MNIVYVSSSSAESIENGTEQYPYKSVQTAFENLSWYGTMRLKCGDIFYLSRCIMVSSLRCNIESYGKGAKPILTHFMICPNTGNLFTNLGNNIWAINLSASLFANNSLIDFDYTDGGVDNYNIAFIYSPVQDKILFGHRVNYLSYNTMSTDHKNYYEDPAHTERVLYGYAYSWLQTDGDFYVNRDENPAKLYVYSTVNPNTLGTLWFSSKCHALNVPYDCCIRNIKITGFGNHGLQGAMSNVLIENVDIDLVGGYVPGNVNRQHDSLEFLREGNGIEIWIPTDLTQQPHNNIIRNCTISRVFDAACSIQGFPTAIDTDTIVASNILFEHNIIKNCRQSIECFANRLESGINYAYPFYMCRFSENICYKCGTADFNTPQEQDAHISWGVRNMEVNKNIFIEGNYHFMARNQPNLLNNNICYIREGQLLVSHVWHLNGFTPIAYPVESDSTTWPSGSSTYSEAVSSAIAAYRTITGDLTTEFYRISE